jgi:uncharacterized membrane protein YjgN (DUF898 family)
MTEQITITCPHCSFRRDVPHDMIPHGAKQANCPKCKQPFPLNAETISLAAAPAPPDVGASAPPPPPPQVAAPAEPPPASPPPQPKAAPSPRTLGFSFDGSARDYFGIWIVNTLLKIVTLGIYSAWAKVRRRRYFYGSTTLDGHSFEYMADPLTLFKGWLIAAVAAVLYGIGTRVSPTLSAVIALIVFAVFPWLVVRSRMFNCRYSSHRNIRFSFRPDYRQAYLVFLGLPLLTPFTLGLLMPYVIYRQKRFLVENSSYGAAPFTFDAGPKDFYKLALKVVACFIAMVIFFAGMTALMGGSLAALGSMGGKGGQALKEAALLPMLLFPQLYFIIIVYGQTRLANLTLNGTALRGARLVSTLRTRDMAWLFISNAVAIACSLGLLMPWATVRMTRYRFERLEMLTKGGLDHLLASSRPDEVGAAGEEIGDLFGFSLDVAL